jgi:hypothetical protein
MPCFIVVARVFLDSLMWLTAAEMPIISDSISPFSSHNLSEGGHLEHL